MNIFYRAKFPYSFSAIVVIAVFLICVFAGTGLWKQNRITIDVPSYYAYLPSLVIYHDLQLNYVDKNPSFFKDKIWFYLTPDGNRIIKHTMGMSVALFPFFITGHFVALLLDAPQNGYSLAYQNAMSFGVLVYLLLGLYYLRKSLLNYFTDKVVAFTLLVIVVGTNLLWYTTYEGLMNHGVSFSLLCICIYHFLKWLDEENSRSLMWFSLCFGLVMLIRPLSVFLLVYFILVACFNKKGISGLLKFLLPKAKTLLLGILLLTLIVFPQFLYWKYISGHWYFDTYYDEHLYFNDPYILDFLFGFRKGWLIYTPIMWLGIIGLLFIYKQKRQFFYPTITSLAISIFIFSSWWAWSYGYCFGMRPMIDNYSILSFPVAATFTFIFNQRKIYFALSMIVVALVVFLNLFQTWQYKNGLIHFDFMTKEAYCEGFLQTSASPEWYDLLKPFDFERRKKGLPQIEYAEGFLQNISENDTVYFRGKNLNFLSTDNAYNALRCVKQEVSSNEIFSLVKVNGDTFAIRAGNKKFISLKSDLRNALIADKDNIGINEKFVLKLVRKNDNRILLQATNGKYLIPVKEWGELTCATEDAASGQSVFRIFKVNN